MTGMVAGEMGRAMAIGDRMGRLINAKQHLVGALDHVRNMKIREPWLAGAIGERVKKLVSALEHIQRSIDDERGDMFATIEAEYALPVPWSVGEWQPGEDYEYLPSLPIFDNTGCEIFSLDAGDDASGVRTLKAIFLAGKIVDAVNAHERLKGA